MSDIDILTQIERALVSDSQTQRDLAMDGAHVEIQRLRKENAILDKELVRHIRHASELISQVERQPLMVIALNDARAEFHSIWRAAMSEARFEAHPTIRAIDAALSSEQSK